MNREEMVEVFMEARKKKASINQQKVFELITKILADCTKAAKNNKPSLRVDIPKFAIEGVKAQLLELKYDVKEGTYADSCGNRKSHWLKITWWTE
jgi:hypothetical protein